MYKKHASSKYPSKYPHRNRNIYFIIVFHHQPKKPTMENLGFSADTQSDEQVRVLTLNAGEHLDGTLYKLKKGERMSYIVLMRIWNSI